MLHKLLELGIRYVDVLVHLQTVSDKLCAGDRFFIIDHLLNGALDDGSLLSLLLFLTVEHVIFLFVLLVLLDYTADRMLRDFVVLSDVLLENVSFKIHFSDGVPSRRWHLLQGPFLIPHANA